MRAHTLFLCGRTMCRPTLRQLSCGCQSSVAAYAIIANASHQKKPTMPEPAIFVENLRKVYSTVVAVDNLSFEVPRGQIFGLLGPNGAGKTTTIRMLMDMIHPDSGTARVLGVAPGEARQRVGYLPEERGLYRTLRVTECLVYLGQLKGMHR